MCMIVQQGDNFELRINNQPFSYLYNGGSRGHGSDSRNSYSSNSYGNSSYGGYGSNEKGSYGRSNTTSYGHKVNIDGGYNDRGSYGNNGKPKEWEDNNREYRRDQRPNNQREEEDGGFDHGFGAFEYK